MGKQSIFITNEEAGIFEINKLIIERKNNFPIVFKNVRDTRTRISRRRRQCFRCGEWINKGEAYYSHQFRYDRTIITISIGDKCFED